MAVQMFYPDDFNGAWVACPDPIDFRKYTVVNIYADTNAYWWPSRWKRVPRPGHRDYLGQIRRRSSRRTTSSCVLGTQGRSGEQWDIWQAVLFPVGADGYPKPIWDKMTGKIDHAVAAYWREHYDLGHILQPRLGDARAEAPRQAAHLRRRQRTTTILNDAVYLVEEFLKKRRSAGATSRSTTSRRAEHCWNGDHTRPNAYSRLRYAQMFIPRIMDQIRKNHPAVVDTMSWRY